MDKIYSFVITADVMDQNNQPAWNGKVEYKNLSYDDMVFVEKHLIQMFAEMNKWAEQRTDKAKAKK